MTKSLAEIQQLVNKLVEQGEDPEEFSFWLAVYETLPEDIQQEFGQILESEIAELDAIDEEDTSSPVPQP